RDPPRGVTQALRGGVHAERAQEIRGGPLGRAHVDLAAVVHHPQGPLGRAGAGCRLHAQLPPAVASSTRTSVTTASRPCATITGTGRCRSAAMAPPAASARPAPPPRLACPPGSQPSS